MLSTTLSSHAATESYFVQPIAIHGMSVINGLTSNGPTSSTQSYYNAPIGADARVDIGAGTLKGLAKTIGNSEGTVSQTRFGDTITVANGVGTNLAFNLAVDGTIDSDAIDPNLNASKQVKVDAYIAIFDAASGANSSNWANFLFNQAGPAPLSFDRSIVDRGNHTSSINETINKLLSGTVQVTQNNQSFLVFANLTLTASRTSNPGSTTLDFLNTATFGVSFDPGVEFSSASGVFPGSNSPQVEPVPLPAGAFLLGSALFGFVLKRRHTAGR